MAEDRGTIVTEAFDAFLQEFRGESDRAAVILGAAKLDILLYQLLVKYLKPSPTSSDALFDGEAPLSSFHAKINLTYRLGLIDDELTRAVHLVRRIRNAFAHEISGASLTSGPQADRVRELIAMLDGVEEFERMPGWLHREDLTTASVRFRTVLAWLLLRLEGVIHYTQRTRPEAQVLVPDQWRPENRQAENPTEETS